MEFALTHRHAFAVTLCIALAACAQPAVQRDALPRAASLPEPALALTAPDGVGAFLTCLRERGVTIVSAHRGGPMAGYPENALETMAARLAEAPMMLEIDVRQTADGTYVLFHDDDLDQDTDGTGPLASRSLAELETVRYDIGGYGISTLEEVLDWSKGRAILQLDVKRGVAFEPLLDWLEARGAQDRALVITYNADDAVTVAQNSDLLISASINTEDDLAAYEASGVPSDRMTAWTGLQAPRPALWRYLGESGISANYGTYATLDEQDGSAEAYAALASAGLHILSSDRPTFAYEALQRQQDFPAAARACSG
ncbi:glycerophosphodiester phosphodiesterase family protein [Sphingomicrobium sp. XHP0239]|uniref:glycerophosphodiester phosphodiesterase family protein n=1 Tax=Sphingomicrobium maritimum TaxID=3133972 RepID=UPI0031CC96E7